MCVELETNVLFRNVSRDLDWWKDGEEQVLGCNAFLRKGSRDSKICNTVQRRSFGLCMSTDMQCKNGLGLGLTV